MLQARDLRFIRPYDPAPPSTIDLLGGASLPGGIVLGLALLGIGALLARRRRRG